MTIRMPALGAEASTARVVTWRRRVGDSVARDEVIGELETEKATVELTAPAAGQIVELCQPEGAEVAVGDVLVVLEAD